MGVQRDGRMALVLHYIYGSTASIPHAVMEEAGLAYSLKALPSGVDDVHFDQADDRVSARTRSTSFGKNGIPILVAQLGVVI